MSIVRIVAELDQRSLNPHDGRDGRWKNVTYQMIRTWIQIISATLVDAKREVANC